MSLFSGSSSARDTEDYRERYPDKKDDEDLDSNVRFYKNEIESKPDGALIEDMLKNWWGDYQCLEKHRGYIQWSFHNYLRITRMLKCLGELGYEQLKKPFIEFILHEAMVKKTLPNLLNSCYNYWINVLRDDDDRLDMWNLYSLLYEQTTESSDEEKIESKKKPKMNNESENGQQSADLKASENGHDNVKVNEQGVSSQEGNIEKLTQVDDSYQLLKAGDENNEDGKKLNMKVESENDAVNFIASASKEVIEGEALTQVGSVEKVNDPDVLMEAEYQNLKASTSKEVIEGEALTQVGSVEKVNNPDVLMEAEYQQVGDNEVTSRHHEQSHLEIDDEKFFSETPVLSKSESVEMIDDSQRWSYDQDKQIDSETPVTRDEQQASLSKKDSVTHDNHSNQEQSREEYQENSCEEKLEAKEDVKANEKL